MHASWSGHVEPPRAGVQQHSLTLDYADAASRDDRLLTSLSAVAVFEPYLWTASDESRTIECLEPNGGGFRLRAQYRLDDLFRNLPNAEDGGARPDEIDLESLAVCGGALWITGSHCRVRRESKQARREKHKPDGRYWIEHQIDARPSRHLLGRVALSEDGGGVAGKGERLPYRRAGSLRHVLGKHPFIGPFVDLPSKENGLDVEGLIVRDRRRLYLGLRGPVVDSYAVIIEVEIGKDFRLKQSGMITHFLDLDGLGVRDLAEFDHEIAILAGPVSEAPGPFRIYGWRPHQPAYVQKPARRYDWPATSEARGGNPEGVCRLDRSGPELIVLYDSPHGRVAGRSYRADWIAIS